ncbi:MAG: RNA binding S1 domain protein [Candidatus Daviesbacteria bacterium GW2011_GWC2_40_12]|uniref:RNA binding S1 domain protein n=1 Tax=Candidatus Daviesbacteria bacterium GW2011_GWC2_40_12 TaxID=1618431 RepID=A0A0G0QVA3_9BACT|nr:MAG: RNA binding S1 domain protein [Candidatus Daviesbacteria bacterium GW2011_GWA2_39_33]KKR41286.1 MAG: RNA binding S1 domain protein [Candidatus Daviesbacteria bacterium GW2011_GWC2_40_12]
MSKNSLTNSSKSIMEELLASQPQKLSTLHRGQEVEGEIVSISDKEIVLDLGTKSEGAIATREIPQPVLKDLKVGDKLKAFVSMQENEHGQVVLSFDRQSIAMRDMRSSGRGGFRGGKSFRGRRPMDWSKFVSARNQKSKLQGKVIEVNKGGLIVEAAGTRGFLPNSQVGFELLSKSGEGMENLIGQDLTITVIEVDQNNNKLIFSQRGQVSDEVKKKLSEFKKDQKMTGKIVAVLPFGLVVDVSGAEGLVFISDVSWDKVDDLSLDYARGDSVEVLILGLDEELGRLNLSIKQLKEDPFTKAAKSYTPDDVIKGEVLSVSEQGVTLRLADEVEGFLPAAKMNPDANYEVGKTVTLLVDSIDTIRRRVILAPFVTSTAGLIYK